MDQPLNIANTFPSINGYGNSKNNSNFLMNKKRNHNFTNSLKTNEIIRGRVLDVYEDNIALVQLPTGTFKCEIAGHLAVGDTLFFQVLSIEPSLVLKIHSVATTHNNATSSSAEIIRILDLPVTILSGRLIDYLKSTENIIKRDDFFEIYKVLGDIDKNELKTFQLNDIFATLDFMIKNSFLNDIKIYNYVKYYFLDYNKLLNILKQSNTENNLIKLLFANNNNTIKIFIKYLLDKNFNIQQILYEIASKNSLLFQTLSAFLIVPIVKIKSKSNKVSLLYYIDDKFTIEPLTQNDNEYSGYYNKVAKISNLSEIMSQIFKLTLFSIESNKTDFKPQSQISIVI